MNFFNIKLDFIQLWSSLYIETARCTLYLYILYHLPWTFNICISSHQLLYYFYWYLGCSVVSYSQQYCSAFSWIYIFTHLNTENYDLFYSAFYSAFYPLKWASLVAQMVKNPPAMQETCVQSLGWEDLMQQGMASHSSIPAWRIPMDPGVLWKV